jgi:hypothetical protein
MGSRADIGLSYWVLEPNKRDDFSTHLANTRVRFLECRGEMIGLRVQSLGYRA